MIRIELSPEEQQVLREVLENSLTDLRVEIVSTDRLEFKDALKHRKSILSRILEELERPEKLLQPA